MRSFYFFTKIKPSIDNEWLNNRLQGMKPIAKYNAIQIPIPIYCSFEFAMN